MAVSKYVTLVSQEGFEFVIMRETAMVSPLIKRMLDPRSQFMESQTGRCHFREIRCVPPSSLPSPRMRNAYSPESRRNSSATAGLGRLRA